MNQTQLLITNSDKTPLIEIFIWIPFAISFLSVAARVLTKAAIIRRLQLEDYLISISLLLALGQSVAVAIQCSNGLGQFDTTLSDAKLVKLSKAGYAAELLFISSIYLAKLSIIIFIVDLTPVVPYKRISKVIGCLITLWIISCMFAASFQCKLPSTWDTLHNSCFNLISFWNSLAIINIITDISLILIIAFIALKLHSTWMRKMVIIGVFGTRIFAIAAIACQLYYQNRPLKDPVFDIWPAVISTQIVECLSIVTACIPYLKPFLTSLESGLIRSDDLHRRGWTAIDSYNFYNSPYSKGSGSKKLVSGKTSGSKTISSGGAHELSDVFIATTPKLCPDNGRAAVKIEGKSSEWDGQSHSSQAKMIKETRTWNIQVQDRNGRELTSEGANIL